MISQIEKSNRSIDASCGKIILFDRQAKTFYCQSYFEISKKIIQKFSSIQNAGFTEICLSDSNTVDFEKHLWFRGHNMLSWSPFKTGEYLKYVPSELNLWVFIISKVSRSIKQTPPSLPPTMIRLFWWDIIRDAMPLLSSFNSNWVCGSIYCRVKRSQQLISALNQHFREPHGPLIHAGTDGPPRWFWLTITTMSATGKLNKPYSLRDI